MVALAITKAMIDKFGSDCMVDVLQNLQAYNERIKG
jgi:chorismate synthase